MTTTLQNVVNIKSDKEINNMSNKDLKLYAKAMNTSYQGLFDKLFDKENGVVPKLDEQLKFA